ncbi:uncharacterized protein LOC122370897 [Amphibalanus amphitrite]|uniref:uncharacterized protein LOC122370897 n=1 Tax=Amphibalanus amphitrite TaxID=1232801 RepID=UPI001C927605|nr:uncharacterized protein LOC122370897 [Amphibalanus amphitrite]
MKTVVVVLLLASAVSAANEWCNRQCCTGYRKGTCPADVKVVLPQPSSRAAAATAQREEKCESHCRDDTHCACGMKCCKIGCARRCMPVCTFGCWKGERCVLEIDGLRPYQERAQCN